MKSNIYAMTNYDLARSGQSARDFGAFLDLVLSPVEGSCGGRGCSTEGRDGPWNLQVITKVIFEAVKSTEAETA